MNFTINPFAHLRRVRVDALLLVHSFLRITQLFFCVKDFL